MVIVFQLQRRTISLAPFEKVVLYKLEIQVSLPLLKLNKKIPVHKENGKVIHIYAMAIFTALFTNMRILKFKSQLTIAFFAAVNHLNGPLRKQNFSLTGSKGQGL